MESFRSNGETSKEDEIMAVVKLSRLSELLRKKN